MKAEEVFAEFGWKESTETPNYWIDPQSGKLKSKRAALHVIKGRRQENGRILSRGIACGVDEYVYLNRYTTLATGADGKLIPDPKYVCGAPATKKHDGIWMCDDHVAFVGTYESGKTVVITPRRKKGLRSCAPQPSSSSAS